MQSNRVIVVGGGAAGCMAAGTAAENCAAVLLLEKNEKLCRKVMITGKGRCNVTNAVEDVQTLISHVPGNGRFLYSAFSAFLPQDTMDFFTDYGVPLKVERGNRVFPQSDRAADIADALVRFLDDTGVHRAHERVTEVLIKDGRAVGVKTASGKTLKADCVIVTTGGLSYPQTGSTGDGYAFAKAAGHTVTPLRPSLSALCCREGFCSDCAGLSLRNVAICVKDTKTKKEIYHDFGEMLFTHFGVSGPMILSASAHMRQMEPARYTITIDLKPALSAEQLDARILRDFNENHNKAISNTLPLLLPHALIPVVLRLAGIKPSEKVNQITREMRTRLLETVKGLPLTVLDFYDIRQAIVTAGGVSTKEVNPKTMESKLVKGLYFAGEVLDVDAYTGGFNLQIAFATGRLAGLNAATETIESEP